MVEVWHREAFTVARKGHPAPPLLEGPIGHPCRTCKTRVARYEFSPHGHTACSLRCLLRQNVSATTALGIVERHGQDAVEEAAS